MSKTKLTSLSGQQSHFPQKDLRNCSGNTPIENVDSMKQYGTKVVYIPDTANVYQYIYKFIQLSLTQSVYKSI